MKTLGKLMVWWRGAALGSCLRKELEETAFSEAWIDSPRGYRIYAHIHAPKAGGPRPGIIIVPGAKSAGTDYDKGLWPRAKDIAACGFTVIHYDPSGRGKTGGVEDNWGPAHQEELSAVARFFAGLSSVTPGDIGIFSFSIGIIISTGALARFPMPEIGYLFDWEGPSNPKNTTRDDTHKPLKEFPTSNVAFWAERDASEFIRNIKCGYFRYQAREDHVQGLYKGHAIELMNNATTGSARWTKCNDNPADTVFDPKKTDDYRWVPGNLNHKGQILKYLLEAHDMAVRTGP